MTQHTKHPWFVTQDDTGGPFTMWPSIVAEEEVDATIVHRAGFKQEFWGKLSLQEATANAHLMAAAPELRDALVAAYEQVLQLSSRLDMPVPSELTTQYKAVIAKSNGTTVPEVPPGDEDSPLWKLATPSTQLAVIVGAEPLFRTEVTKKIWEYIKTHNLQDPTNRRMINTDAKLKQIFDNKDVVSMFEMTKLISNHLK